MEPGAEVVEERPALAIALLVIVAALAYAGVSYAFDGTVDALEVVVFAVTFAVVYVGFRRYVGF